MQNQNFKFSVGETVTYQTWYSGKCTIATREATEKGNVYTIQNGDRVLETQFSETEVLSLQDAITERIYKAANSAYTHLSHSPERRAFTTTRDTLTLLAEDLTELANSSEELKKYYSDKFIAMVLDWLGSLSNCASAMIVGPARFPSARMQKRHQWADNKYTAFMQWRVKTIGNVKKKAVQAAKDAAGITPLIEAQKKLQNREALHEVMKKTNAFLRKCDKSTLQTDPYSFVPALIAAVPEIDEARARQLLTYDRLHGYGFASFSLTNNLAEIKRLQGRVKLLESKETKAAAGTEDKIIINGVEIVNNYEADRVQIFFDGKPSDAVRTALKSRGFRWSPSQNAWQRQLTNEAGRVAKNIVTEYCKAETA